VLGELPGQSVVDLSGPPVFGTGVHREPTP
jgi:hypothetical protein